MIGFNSFDFRDGPKVMDVTGVHFTVSTDD